jgi:hypothetical protein
MTAILHTPFLADFWSIRTALVLRSDRLGLFDFQRVKDDYQT